MKGNEHLYSCECCGRQSKISKMLAFETPTVVKPKLHNMIDFAAKGQPAIMHSVCWQCEGLFKTNQREFWNMWNDANKRNDVTNDGQYDRAALFGELVSTIKASKIIQDTKVKHMAYENKYGKKEEQKEEAPKGKKPDFRMVASVKQKDGTDKLVRIGCAWENSGKSGVKYLSVRFDKLLLFRNEGE